VHFADTMRGGQYLNNWRMAELHAKEAPDRVRELEAWGAVFDRTPDGRILQRNFGGHRYPRLAHVGDRTGLELIRTLQDHGIHQGIDVHMECTVIELLQGRRRRAGAFAYDRERGRFQCSRRRPWCWRPAASAAPFKITSNSWEYTGDGHALAYAPAPSSSTWSSCSSTRPAWSGRRACAASWSPRACAARAACCEQRGPRFMFDDIPDNYKPQTADNEEEGWRYTQGDKRRGVRPSC
jgi:succinate dehydrogenase / fumarate reductase, flavoprotein subunit